MKIRKPLFFRFLKLFFFMSMATLVLTTLAYLPIGQGTMRMLKIKEMQPVLDSMENIMQDYIVGQIDERSMNRIIIAQSIANNAQLIISDTTGSVIFATKPITDDRHAQSIDQVDISQATGELMKEILGNHKEVDENLTLAGTSFESIFLGKPIEINGRTVGAIALVIPAFEINRAVNALVVSLILSMALVMLLMSIVIYFFTRRITKPIAQMTDVAKRMSLGDFSLKADDRDLSEIGALGLSLNQMSGSLKETLEAVSIERNRLKNMLESMNEGVVSMAPDGSLMVINPAFFQLFAVETEGTDPQAILGLESVKEAFRQGLAGHLNHRLFDLGERKIALSVSPIVSEESAQAGCIGIFIDRSESERLEKMRRDYVANVSHELRTPLTAIRALLDPLNDGLIRDEQKKQDYYRTLLKETDRLNRLIDNLLELSRLQSSNESFHSETVRLDRFLDDLQDKFEAVARQKPVELKIVRPAAPLTVVTNEDRLEQVLSILIDNALKFTPDNGTITVSLKQDEGIELSVRDTGPGISPEDLPHIFERFYTADKARTQKSFGLGLSIAKEILERMHATIRVESALDQGTTFTVRLP